MTWVFADRALGARTLNPRIKKTGSAILEAVRARPILRRTQALAAEVVGCRPVPFVGVAARVAAPRRTTVRFQAWRNPSSQRNVQALCGAAPADASRSLPLLLSPLLSARVNR